MKINAKKNVYSVEFLFSRESITSFGRRIERFCFTDE